MLFQLRTRASARIMSYIYPEKNEPVSLKDFLPFRHRKARKAAKAAKQRRHSLAYVKSNWVKSDYFPSGLIKRRPDGWSKMIDRYLGKFIESDTQGMRTVLLQSYRPISPAPYGSADRIFSYAEAA